MASNSKTKHSVRRLRRLARRRRDAELRAASATNAGAVPTKK
jgi:hypothetical protein